MERLFYAWPLTEVDGKDLEFTAENFRAIRGAWRDPARQAALVSAYTRFFRRSYAEVERLERGESAGVVR
jgi:hypothetical protein